MFTSIKMEDYTESELSRIKVVTINVVIGSFGTHVMHIRVKPW